MKQVGETLDMHLPSFSIVLETENLANADLKGLSKSLASLANQDLPLTLANEVLPIDSSDTPLDLLNCACQQYPWIKIHQIQLSASLHTSYFSLHTSFFPQPLNSTNHLLPLLTIVRANILAVRMRL